jgi:hypothetical protein
MRRLPLLLLTAALVTGASTACARGVDFGPDTQQTQAINVYNEMSHPMIVAFDDGTGERLLGTVAARSTDRFVIAGTSATTISVVAYDQGRTHTVRRTVTLVPGASVDVRIN